ncbi:MAG: response regulator [Brevinematales bacterium]|jgi:CheY-like chemotaxis protein
MDKNNKILIVEDEAITAMMICENLKMSGFGVMKPVSTGEEAVNAAVSEKPDVIFMDIHLAGSMDGIEAAEKISESLVIPIIFMTGYTNQDFIERTKNLRPVYYLNKPIRIKDMEKIIESL